MADSCLYETVSRRFIVDTPGISLGMSHWSRGWFLPTVARGDQLLSSSSLVVFALSGEASVESSTFNCPRAEAALFSFACSAPLWPFTFILR